MTEFKFAVGGTVQAAQGTYLPRPVDKDLFEACRKGEYAYVLASRQIGKSSLMIEIAHNLSEEDIKTAIIDLNRIGSDRNISADQWYFTFVDRLTSQLELENIVNLNKWWESHSHLTNSGRFIAFLEKVVLVHIKEPIVIFVDEIDSTIPLDFTDDFFIAIRNIYNNRATNQEYRRITFVLLGVATPGDLIKDKSRTPYNIGQEIPIRDFKKEDCKLLRQTLVKAEAKSGAQCFDQVYAWTNGHPYLTQYLCRIALKQLVEEQDASKTPKNGIDLVDTLINDLFLAAEDLTDNNLQFVENIVLRDQYADRMLEIYRKILDDQEPAVQDNDHSIPISRLKLYGLVVTQNGELKVRNKLYEQMFDNNWVENMLKNARLGLPDQYKILKQLGQRGQVKIYLAQRQDIDPAPSVLVKVLDVSKEPGIDWAEWFTRLEKEVAVIQRSRHENIVPITDFGRVDEETLYIVLDYIEGGDLKLKLKEEDAIPRNQALDWVRQIASALERMHKQQILHLNVTPRDILFDTRQTPEKPMLTDFGFANFGLGGAPLDVHHDYIAVTKEYVAPEVMQHGAPSAAADVYSLAVTLFEMLAGQLPEGREPGTPLSPLSSLAPEVGDYFDTVLIRATANDPQERYQSMSDFLNALEDALDQAAADKIEAARIYMVGGAYKTQTAHTLLEEAFEIAPYNPEALQLRGEVWLKEGKFEEALADYRQAFEVENADISSQAGQAYLQALKDVADTAWHDADYTGAIKYYREIREHLIKVSGTSYQLKQHATARLIEYHREEGDKAYKIGNIDQIKAAIKSLEKLNAQNEVDDLKDKLIKLHVKSHYNAGLQAYNSGNPEDIPAAIKTLEDAVKNMQAHNAETEREDLEKYLTTLKIEYRKRIIAESLQQIGEIKETRDERIFQLYDTVDIAYEELQRLEPDNQRWSAKRRETLEDQAKWRLDFAGHHEMQENYVAALNHYNAIRTIEEKKGTGSLDKILGIALTEKIEELNQKVNFDEKYEAIKALMEQKQYNSALNKLEQDFIRNGHYSHRNVTVLLWQLVEYEKNGKLPSEEPPPLPVSPSDDPVPKLRTQLGDLQGQLITKEQEIKDLQAKLTAQAEDRSGDNGSHSAPTQVLDDNKYVNSSELQQAENIIESLNSKLDRLYPLLYLGWGLAAASLIGLIAYIVFLTQ